MKPDQKHQALLAAVALALAAVFSLWYFGRAADSDAAATRQQPRSVSQGDSSVAQSHSAAARAPAWYESAMAKLAMTLGIANPVAYRDVEVCGIGTERIRDGDGAMPPLFGLATEQAWAAWRFALLERAAPADRVAVHFVKLSRSMQSAIAGIPHSDERKEALNGNAVRAARQAGAPMAQEVFGIADASDDPAIVFAALALCGYSAEAGCARRYAEKLTRVDNDNAFAWLQLARAAHESNDDAPRNKALIQAGHAPRLSPLPNPARRLLASAELAQMETQRRYRLSFLLNPIAFDTTLWRTEMFAHCRPGVAWSDPTHTDRCTRFADQLAAHPEVLSLSLAAVLGANEVWPNAKREAAMLEHEALIQELTAMSSDQPLSCAALKQQDAFARESASIGDRVVLRNRILARGETVEQAGMRARRATELSRSIRHEPK
jgi:hypothetical protein